MKPIQLPTPLQECRETYTHTQTVHESAFRGPNKRVVSEGSEMGGDLGVGGGSNYHLSVEFVINNRTV